MFGTSKNRLDFYVYSPNGNFGVDVFYPNTIKTLQSNVNIKMSKYEGFKENLYFVVANSEIDQESLIAFIQKKKKPLTPNTTLISLDAFMNMIRNMKAYPNPIR
jgi:hypothetical protein